MPATVASASMNLLINWSHYAKMRTLGRCLSDLCRAEATYISKTGVEREEGRGNILVLQQVHPHPGYVFGSKSSFLETVPVPQS